MSVGYVYDLDTNEPVKNNYIQDKPKKIHTSRWLYDPYHGPTKAVCASALATYGTIFWIARKYLKK